MLGPHQLGSLRNSPGGVDTMSNASFLQGMKATLTQRKQSHENRSGRNNQLSSTMGSGLRNNANSIMSPRDVISEARQQVLAQTITEGLKPGNRGQTQSAAKGGPNKGDHGLSVQDIVDSMLKKQTFGMDDYNPKAVVKDLLPVHTHVRAKSKRRMFTEEAIKAKAIVPSSTKYQTFYDWKKDPVSRNIKFYSDKRVTQAM